MRIKVLSGGRKSIELPLSDAELNFQMKRIGIEETVPVCRLVEASEKDNPLCKFEGQTVNMDEVNFFAKRMDCLTEYERKVLYSYVTDYGVGTMQDLINLTFSMKGLSLITDFSDAEQVGKRLYLDEFIAMPEEEKQQTNFIKFAEKTFKESRVEVLPYGVFVEHGFEMQEVYNGKTFPEYFASDEIVAAIEVQNQAGDTEYLYLPTDICSMNKVKERLQVMDFWEMKVTDIHNIRLPDILVPMPENIDCVEALTLFNETCQAVRHFDEVQMKQLAMVVEFTGFSSHTEVTSLAKLLGEFEVNPFVHNDEEYELYQRFYGGKSVHGSTGQPVLAVCIPARNVRFGDYGHYQCRKHWSDSTAGVNVCIFSGNRKSHSDDFLCSHDGLCSNQSVLCQLKKRWNPLNPDSGWKPLYVLCSQRIHRWIYPVVQAGHWHLYHCVFAVHYLNRRTYGI